MSEATAPNTLAIANAIVGYAAALTYSGGGLVYTATTIGQFKDVSDNVANGGACLEIYGHKDDSEHMAFGGQILDTQSFQLISMVNMDNAVSAETLIMQVRDALVVPLQRHVTLGNAGDVFFAQIEKGSGQFFDVDRNGQWLRAHMINVVTMSQWQTTITN